MKIFLITKEPFPNGLAAVKRIKAYVKAWKHEGITCEILIYTRTEKYGVPPKNLVGEGEVDGVHYRYLKGTPLREANIISRCLNDWLDYQRLRRYLHAKLSVGDIVFSYGRDLKLRKLIREIQKIGGVFYNELCELPFGTSYETSKTIKLRQKYERKIMPLFDGVIVISDALKEYAIKHCKKDAKISKIPILVDYEKYNMVDLSSEAEIPYIFHSGTLFEQKDGFLSMLEAFGKMSTKCKNNVRFISTGNPVGSRHEHEIKKIIEKYNLEDKVFFTGFIPDDELRKYLAQSSFVVINKLNTQQNIYCFSTKLGEYMAASKPVLTTDIGEAQNWLTHGYDAYIVPADNIDKLCEAMELLFKDVTLRKKLGENANKTCQRAFGIESNYIELKKAVTE